MNELCSVAEMIERIKDTLSLCPSVERTRDKHVAYVLRISDNHLSTLKKRNKLPLREIILFCDRCGLDPMKIVMKRS